MALRTLALLLCLTGLASPAPAQNTKENADFKLAINLYNDKLYDLAAEQLRQFINSYPQTDQGVEARFYLGLSQLQLKQYEEARLTFQSFALTYQTNPRSPEAWWNVGLCYASMGNMHEAALAYERVKVFHPKSKLASDALIRAGSAFLEAGQRDDARRVLRIVLQEYGSSGAVPQARTLLGRIYFEEGNLAEAQSELRRVVEGDPSPDARAQALLILGNIAQRTGRVDQAQARYREITTTYKATSAVQAAHVGLANLAIAAGSYDEAIDNLRKALATKTAVDSALVREAMFALGEAHAGRRQYQDAVTSFEQFAAAFPADQRAFEAHWRAASASAQAKNYRTSNDLCNRLLASGAPDGLRRRARLQLALNAEDQKSLQLAVQLFGTFIEQYPDDPTTPDVMLRTAGMLEKSLRDPRKAGVVYDLLTSRHPTSAYVDDAVAGSARCQEQLREFERASQLYGELVRRFPGSEFRAQADERIRMIEIFEAKDKDAGLEKLAGLLGDVVAETDRAALAFRLGEIYFHELKNYAAAAAQFTNSYTGGISLPRAADALYFRSRSYEYLSWKDERYRRLAVESYQTFLQTTEGGEGDQREEAAAALFRLSSATLQEARSSYASVEPLLQTQARRDEVMLRLGGLLAEADSTDAALEALARVGSPSAPSPAREAALIRRIEIFRTAGRDSAVSAEGSRFIEEYPDGRYTPTVLSWLADLAVRSSDDTRAVELYRRLSADYYYTALAPEARRRLAASMVRTGDYAGAITAYTEELQRSRSHLLGATQHESELLVGLGRAQYLAGNPAGAKVSLFEALKLDRKGAGAGEAYTTLGMIYRAEGAADIASSYYRQAELVAPEAATSREVADLLFESGAYADAYAQYRRLALGEKDPRRRRQHESRAVVCLLRQDEISKAETAAGLFEKSYEDNAAELADFELEKGNSYFRREDYAKAMRSFQTVMRTYETTPSAPAARYWAARALEATGKPQEALQMLEELLAEAPDAPIIPRVHLALGNLFYGMEKWDQAVRHYRSIVDAASPDTSVLRFAMNNLIETYEIANIPDAALALTRQYLERYPTSDDAFDKRIKIGILYSRLGYYDQAVLHLEDLLDEAGSDLEAELRYYIGDAQYNKGNYQQAILEFLKVPYLVTKKGKIDWTANALYMAGQSYEKMGRYEQSLGMYRQILERPGIDETYRTAARKEIDRVKLALTKKAK